MYDLGGSQVKFSTCFDLLEEGAIPDLALMALIIFLDILKVDSAALLNTDTSVLT